MTIKKKTLKFIPASQIIPVTANWFWHIFSTDAPFSWGDNDLTLIKASRFAEHFENRMDLFIEEEITIEELKAILEQIKKLGDNYIGLEC